MKKLTSLKYLLGGLILAALFVAGSIAAVDYAKREILRTMGARTQRS